MTSEERGRLRQRMSGLSDAELLRIINVEFRDYRPEALEYAKAELESRGVVSGRGKVANETLQGEHSADHEEEDDEDTSEDDSDQDESAEFKPSFCIVCGAETRSGYLFGGRSEMTVVFSDNNEERFVQLDACSKCGHVRVIVDFETDVAQ